MIYLNLFLTFMYFGLFCLSGGGALMQFYLDELVNRRHWMTLEGFGNFVAISQVTPGPIGVNLATFIGYHQGGIPGGLLSTVGLLLPSFFMMSLAVYSYRKWQENLLLKSLMFGVKPVTVSLIVTAVFACLGMSVFTAEIPFDWIMEFLSGEYREYEGAFALRPEMFPILFFSVWVLYRRKLSILSVIFLSALSGMILYPLFGAG